LLLVADRADLDGGGLSAAVLGWPVWFPGAWFPLTV